MKKGTLKYIFEAFIAIVPATLWLPMSFSGVLVGAFLYPLSFIIVPMGLGGLLGYVALWILLYYDNSIKLIKNKDLRYFTIFSLMLGCFGVFVLLIFGFGRPFDSASEKIYLYSLIGPTYVASKSLLLYFWKREKSNPTLQGTC